MRNKSTYESITTEFHVVCSGLPEKKLVVIEGIENTTHGEDGDTGVYLQSQQPLSKSFLCFTCWSILPLSASLSGECSHVKLELSSPMAADHLGQHLQPFVQFPEHGTW